MHCCFLFSRPKTKPLFILLCEMQTVKARFSLKSFEQKPKPTFKTGLSTTTAPLLDTPGILKKASLHTVTQVKKNNCESTDKEKRPNSISCTYNKILQHSHYGVWKMELYTLMICTDCLFKFRYQFFSSRLVLCLSLHMVTLRLARQKQCYFASLILRLADLCLNTGCLRKSQTDRINHSPYVLG